MTWIALLKCQHWHGWPMAVPSGIPIPCPTCKKPSQVLVCIPYSGTLPTND